MTGGRGKRHAAFLTSAAVIGLATYQMAGAQEVPVDPIPEAGLAPQGIVQVPEQPVQTEEAEPEVVEEAEAADTVAEIEEDISPRYVAPGFSYRPSLANPYGSGFSPSARPRRTQPGADQPEGFNVQGNVDFGIDVNDNSELDEESPGTDTTLYTALGIDIRSDTPTDRLRLSFGGDLQYEDLATANEDNGFVDPYVRFFYNSQGVDSELDFRARYTENDIVDSFFVDTDGDLIEDTILANQGTVERIDLDATYSFGIDAPFGMDLTIGHNERNYSDVLDPGLYDRSLDRVGAVARFRINPALTAELIARMTWYDAEDEDQTERETTDLGFGIDYEIRPDLVLNARLANTDIEETTVDGVEDNNGLTAEISLDRELNNGTFGLFLNRYQYTETARSELGFIRAMDLAYGSLAYSLGVSWSDTGDTVLIGSLDYINELPTGAFTASLSQTATTNVDDDEVERTILGIGYSHDINSVSGLDFGVDVAHVQDIGVGNTNDSTRVDYGVTYRHQLTQDWDWRLGYEGRYRRDTDGFSANSNAIFTSIGRSFSIR